MLNSIKRPPSTFLSKDHSDNEGLTSHDNAACFKEMLFSKCSNQFFLFQCKSRLVSPASSTSAMSFLFKIFNPKKNTNALSQRVANLLQPLCLAKLIICGM